MRLQDLAIVTNTPLDTDPALLEKFKAHDKVQYDPKTDLYSYKVRRSLPLLQIRRQFRISPVSSTNSRSETKLPY